MARTVSPQPTSGGWLTDGLIMTVANLVAAAGNYLFQAWMRRHLPWSEFGYMNASIGLVLLASVPMTAASLAVTHHLALLRAAGQEEKMIRMQAAALKGLRHLTWVLCAVSLALIYPVSAYLHVPRMGLAWIALLCVPVNLWTALGGAWCTGLSRFRLLSALLIAAAFVRVLVGVIAVDFYPWAEAGVGAGIVSGLVLAGVVVWSPHHGAVARLRGLLYDREFMLYGVAALAVSFGAFFFMQADQILAQRYFPGDELGRFSGAGLLGRMIVWGSLPVLTVYFTRRSGAGGARSSATPLLAIYLVMIAVGAVVVALLRVPLLDLFLGTHDPVLAGLTSGFALAMFPIGILHAMGCHYLAARRIVECLCFGGCGLVYLLALAEFGRAPELMLAWMTYGAAASVGVLGLVSLLRRKAVTT